MARQEGIFKFSANFEPLISAPLDARVTVENIDTLTNGLLPYPYIGMLVSVTSDETNENNGVYVLKSSPASEFTNWVKLGTAESVLDTKITSVTFEGTTQTITLSNGTEFQTDINWLTLSGNQFMQGITNHSFQKIVSDDFKPQKINSEDFNVVDIKYGTEYDPAKNNVIIIDLITDENLNHLVKLPNTLNEGESGIIYKIIVKRNNIENIDKFLLIYSESITEKYKIYSANVRTEVNNMFYLPLETLESVELIFDGEDYLATNIVKQQYVEFNAKTYIDLDPDYNQNYAIRDLNDLT